MPERLARCAFELFAERGFKNINLDQVAARAGVTKGSLYWHYKNKKELVLAACRHYYDRWQADVRAAIAASNDPMDRLHRALSFSVDACVLDRRNRMFTTGIFILMQEDAEVRAGWARFYADARAFYVGLIDAAQTARRLPRKDARRDADLMLEAMEGLKLRAGFEPRVAKASERRAIVGSLMEIFAYAAPSKTVKSDKPAATTRR
jgi:AcrR family transcriptional regulator